MLTPISVFFSVILYFSCFGISCVTAVLIGWFPLLCLSGYGPVFPC